MRRRGHFTNKPEWRDFLAKFDNFCKAPVVTRTLLPPVAQQYPKGISRYPQPMPGHRWVYNGPNGVSYHETRDSARMMAGLKPGKAA